MNKETIEDGESEKILLQSKSSADFFKVPLWVWRWKDLWSWQIKHFSCEDSNGLLVLAAVLHSPCYSIQHFLRSFHSTLPKFLDQEVSEKVKVQDPSDFCVRTYSFTYMLSVRYICFEWSSKIGIRYVTIDANVILTAWVNQHSCAGSCLSFILWVNAHSRNNSSE